MNFCQEIDDIAVKHFPNKPLRELSRRRFLKACAATCLVISTHAHTSNLRTANDSGAVQQNYYNRTKS